MNELEAHERQIELLSTLFQDKIKALLDDDKKDEAYEFYHLHNFVINAIAAYHTLKMFAMSLQGAVNFSFKQ